MPFMCHSNFSFIQQLNIDYSHFPHHLPKLNLCVMERKTKKCVVINYMTCMKMVCTEEINFPIQSC